MSPEGNSDAGCDAADGLAAERSPERSREAGEAAGGDPSNTPPSITKCLGGEDWLELSLYLQHRRFDSVKKWLDAAREAAESNEKGPDELEIAGRKFLMQPSSATAGTKEKHITYRWRLRSEDGWWLLLMNRADVHSTLPTGIARASSLPLLRIGPKAFLQQLAETVDDLSVDFEREKLSRVDACVDLAGLAVDSLHRAFMRGYRVCRGRYSVNYIADESIEGHILGRRPTGFAIGKGDIRLRVYDKLLKSLNDAEILLLMQTRRWGGVVIKAIRAEFELHREKLKLLGVDSINDWWEKRGAVTSYLSHEWCRVTASKVDSTHTDRAPTHRDWIKIQDAFTDWAGSAVGDLSPLPRLPIRADHLLEQVAGALVSYHARVGTNIDNNETFAHESFYALLDLLDVRDMAEEVRRRAVELGAQVK